MPVGRPPIYSMPELEAWLISQGVQYTSRKAIIRSVSLILPHVKDVTDVDEVMRVIVHSDLKANVVSAWNKYAQFMQEMKGAHLQTIDRRKIVRALYSEDDERFANTIREFKRCTGCTFEELWNITAGDVARLELKEDLTRVIYRITLSDPKRVAMVCIGAGANQFNRLMFGMILAEFGGDYSERLCENPVRKYYLFRKNILTGDKYTQKELHTFLLNNKIALRPTTKSPDFIQTSPWDDASLFVESSEDAAVREWLNRPIVSLEEAAKRQNEQGA